MEKASFTKRGSKRGGDFSPSNLAYFVKRSLKWGDLDALKCALKEAKIELISAKEAQKEVSISKLEIEEIPPKEAFLRVFFKMCSKLLFEDLRSIF
jgi:hypothetical protein